jgi:hypothetical protein
VGPVVSMAADTVTPSPLRFPVPIFATPAWILAVTAADGLCQCTGQCGRKHTRSRTETAAQCTARQGAPGVMLHLTESGTVHCQRCHGDIARAAERAAKRAAPPPDVDQLELFALPD